jgi:hypothetical protein
MNPPAGTARVWVDTDYREDVVKELVLACGRDFGARTTRLFPCN